MDYTKLQNYLEQGLSTGKIGKLEGVGQTTVRYWMKKYKLKSKNKSIKDWTKEDFLRFSTQNIIQYNQNRTSGPKRVEELDWKEIQSFYDQSHTWDDICEKFEINLGTISEAQKAGLFISRRNNETLKLTSKKRPPVKLSEETKKKISDGRKKYLAANPDKHGWSNSKHHRSVPCELLKSKLQEQGIAFVEEFKPLLDQGRFFSIDIYFPDLKIGWEVNGSQHYELDGSLKPYYQNRNDLITVSGVKLIEIRYHKVFSEEFVNQLMQSIENQRSKCEGRELNPHTPLYEKDA